MQAIDRPFTKIINGTTQFVIPVFQRDYSWTEAQCAQLWKDTHVVASGESDQGHFLGSVVYIPTGDSSAGFTRWLLIDGQQRVTTLTLLLIALRDHISEAEWQGDDDDDPTVKRIEAYFLKNVQEDGDREAKLVLRRHDHATLSALLNATELPNNASERIMDNYDYFREQLTDANLSQLYRGIGRLVVVDVTLDRQKDDPQLIFESLNSTGMDLSQSDLIRNFILMRLPEAEQTLMYDEYWSKIETLFRGSGKKFDDFVRDYIALKFKASKQSKANEIYYNFRRTFHELEAQLGGLQETLADMLRYARYHAAFSLGVGTSKVLTEALSNVRSLVDVPAILVMKLFDVHERVGSLSEDHFRQALELVESYVIRRAICGEQTRGYWQIFANLAYKIDDESPLDSFMVGLARQQESYRFPSDVEFKRELFERDIYGLRVCRFLLERLENQDSREPTDTSEYSIEHIMPQNEKLPNGWKSMLGVDAKKVHAEWLHRLGNLSLTAYNSTYKDRSFNDKKTIAGGFSESSVRLNKFVRDQPQWTSVEMSKRGNILASQALKVWKDFSVDQSLIDAVAEQEKRDLASRRDVTKVNMSIKAGALFKELRKRINDLNEDVIELAESKSISYHGPSFFLEVLPRKHQITLLLPLDYNEIDCSSEIAEDATQWKFFFHAKYEGGVALRINSVEDIESSMPIIRQAYSVGSN